MLEKITHLFDRDSRTTVGIMSGTSIDAVDVAVVNVSGSGTATEIEVLGTGSTPIEPGLKRALLRNAEEDSSSVREIALLNVHLAHVYAEAVRQVLAELGLALTDIDAVGSHGQTIFHAPEPDRVAGASVRATLQIGDASTLACLLGTPVVADFRPADMALGGQGAPLVPYFDFIRFRSREEGRVLLNLGGIANVTVLPSACELEDVRAFDTGPANVLVDALAAELLEAPCDAGGRMAAGGRVHEQWLGELLKHDFFAKAPPKSTGRELFSHAYTRRFIESGKTLGLSDADLFATATTLTTRSIAEALRRFIEPTVRISRLIVSGGGVFNKAMMAGLEKAFPGTVVETSAAHGIDPLMKEAVCFAVLANETLNGSPSNVPSATGAARPAVLGKISLPS